MLIWEKSIPEHLTEKSNIRLFVIFTAIFALVFINIYAPFGLDTWYEVTELQLFFYSSIVILIGMLVIVISRILMLKFSKIKTLKYGVYALWIAGEILAMALVYTLIQKFFLDDQREFIPAFKKSIQITALVIMLPYIILWLYLSWREQNRKLNNLKIRVVTDNVPHGLIPFRDEKGILKFSVRIEDLLYIEAADNYAAVHYIDQNKISKYLIRSSMKKLEEELSDIGLIRCHRSFIVNFEKIKIIEKDKEGLKLELDHPLKISLPVSKTYIDQVIRKFSGYGSDLSS